MTKARDLADLISTGNPLADGAIAASEVSGLATVATSGAASDVSGLHAVATSGAYSGLSGKPTLGTAAALNVGTSANNIVQLDGSGNLPAVSGANLTGLSSSGNLFTAPADGTVTNGDMLVLRSDGDVAKVAVEATAFPFNSSNTAVSVESAEEYTTLERTKIAVNKSDPTKFCIIGKTDNGRGYISTGTVSNGTVTMTNGAIFHQYFYEGDVCHLEGDRWVVAWRSDGEYGRVKTWNSAGTNNGGAFGTQYTFATNSTYRISIDSPKDGETDADKCCLIWMDNNAGNVGKAAFPDHNGSGGLTDTGSSYHTTWESQDINGQTDLFFERVNGNTQGVIAYRSNTSSTNYVKPFRYSGGTGTFGGRVSTDLNAKGTGLGFRSCAIAYNENQSGIFVVSILNNTGNTVDVVPFTFSEGSSGNLPSNITKGTGITGSVDVGETALQVFLAGNTTNLGGVMYYNGYDNKVQVTSFTISSNVITVGTTSDIATGGNDNDRWKSVAAVDANNAFEFYGLYSDGTDAFVESFNLPRTLTVTSLNTLPFVGVAQNSASSGQTVTVMTKGGIDDAQSGLTIGSTYYIQDNGTLGTSAGSVSTVAGTALSATTLLIGD